jgi:hypothetical protein
MGRIVIGQMLGNLQSQGRFARPFLAEHDRCRRIARIPIDLVPRRMIRVGNAMVFENRIGLRILLGKWISRNPMMLKELMDLHSALLPQPKAPSPWGAGAWQLE